jgi:hypothetical protein
MRGRCCKCGKITEVYGKEKLQCDDCYDQGYMLRTTLDGMVPKIKEGEIE